MNKKKLPIGLFLTLLLILVFVFYKVSKTSKVKAFSTKKAPETLNEILKERKEWSEIYDIAGANSFWEILKDRYGQNYHRHTVAHMFGELLYDKEGSGGIINCDAAFSYGCYHAFFGQVLAGEGLDAVFELDKACAEKFGPQDSGCQHGIGHGLLQYLGYDNLTDALEACKSLPERGRSCYEGVFMENNFRTDIEGVEADENIRTINQQNVYAPCTTMGEEYKDACYYELPRWWERVYESDFLKLGQLCGGVIESVGRENCFRGIGAVAVLASDHNLEETKSKCSLMPTSEGRNYCLVEASWAFYSIDEYAHLATKVCEALDGEMKALCVSEEK